MSLHPAATLEVLLKRQGLVFVPEAAGPKLPDDYLRAIEIELADIGRSSSRAERSPASRSDLGPVSHRTEALWATRPSCIVAAVFHT